MFTYQSCAKILLQWRGLGALPYLLLNYFCNLRRSDAQCLINLPTRTPTDSFHESYIGWVRILRGCRHVYSLLL